MAVPILMLPPIKWDFSINKTIFQQATKLGDGYSQILIAPNSVKIVYDIVIPNLDTQSKNDITSTFKQYGGITRFKWRPNEYYEYKEFICDKWSVTNQGTYLWEITATFNQQL